MAKPHILHLPNTPEVRHAINEYLESPEPRELRKFGRRGSKNPITAPDETSRYYRMSVPAGVTTDGMPPSVEMVHSSLYQVDPRIPFVIAQAMRPRLKEALESLGLSPDMPLRKR